MFHKRPKAYEPAEVILLQALARPTLHDRGDVLDRLIGLYEEWGKPQQQAHYEAELDKWNKRQSLSGRLIQSARSLLGGAPPKPAPPSALGRNDPCWCGSGKKYKHCHMREDMESGRGEAVASRPPQAAGRKRRRR